MLSKGTLALVLLACFALAGFTPVEDKEEKFIGARGKYWAFQKVVRPAVPAHPIPGSIPRSTPSSLGPACQEPEPSAPLDRIQLIRRVTFDLTGLPPTPAEVDAFLEDSRPNAYEKVVDRLLASPHYGERWARTGWTSCATPTPTASSSTRDRPHAWRYRDYVIDAFNQRQALRPVHQGADRRRRAVSRQ